MAPGRMQGAVAFVTGGGAGIGRAISLAFAAEGARVAVVDIDPEAAEETVQKIAAAGGEAVAVEADVASEPDVARAVATVVQRYGRIDTLVNNAGINCSGTPVDELQLEVWERVLAVNLRGPFLCVKHAVPHMPPGSTIVNIASTRAFMSEPHTEPYSASKGGIVALTHALAISLGPRRIRVNCISPGWIDTSGWQKAGAVGQVELTEADHAQHPVGRVGRPEDIARACIFLATEDSSFMTGANVIIDGGMTVKMIYV